MRYLISVIIIMISFGVFGQDYYITKQGDSVKCEIKRVFPDEIKVRTDKEDDVSFEVNQVKGFIKDGIYFASKVITNRDRKPFIFLPGNTGDLKYNYDKKFKLGAWDWVKADVIVTSGRGIRIYELIESGSPSKDRMARIEHTLYIENDTLGLRLLPYISGQNDVEKVQVINVLRSYLRHDAAIAKKLTLDEPWKSFNYKGVRKLIEEYIGKKFVD